MVFEVLLQVPRGGEGLGAEAAWVGLDLVMGHSMVVKVGGGCEALATGLTPVWLLPSVDPPVCVEAGAGGELLGTKVTLVRPLPCVDPDVSLQQAGSVKLLATGVAWEQSLGLVFGLLEALQGIFLILIHNINFKILIFIICGLV